ncbi:histidine kinase dimerization/phosphoacceptor domain -containing protein [Rhizobium sp. BG4]|uniref:sensor histidine kinase n=1 Tax=Rhizobium sp. BG4 TaxID=2613770 RepID=UPI00193EBCFF|nr:histidine kinase dimerization/phosphoacceptor domain -containing protein [Rhizobium sp. BG4]QRM47310.1 sensor histidine kinase [Rhizobium sp. BG4]
MRTQRDSTIVGKAAVGAIAAMFCGLAVVLSLWLHSSYWSAVTRGEEQVTATTKIVAANAIWINSLARQTLYRMADAVGDASQPLDATGIKHLNQATAGLPVTATAYVIAPDGHVIYSNDRENSPSDIADQLFFKRLSNGAEDYTSALTMLRGTNRHVFLSATRIERNRIFAGVAVLAFDAGMLRAIWDAASLGKGSTVSFIRRDGKLIARHPEAKDPVDLGNYVLFTDYMRKATAGTYISASPVDGVTRLVGYRIVERTPFVAIASAEVSAIMWPFWRDVLTAATVLLLALAAATTGALKILSLAKAEAQRTTELAQAVRTNKVLMREIHHRVKNNLQTVMALIRLQGLKQETVQRLHERIIAMSAVHEQMYGFDQFRSVQARDFIPNLVRTLVDLHDRDIALNFEIDDIEIDADKATPFALLLNELLTNAMKYAFDTRQDGRIEVRLQKLSTGRVRLEVSDDGIGYVPAGARSGMGTRLIKSFVSQMSGEYRYEQAGGTVFIAEISLG